MQYIGHVMVFQQISVSVTPAGIYCSFVLPGFSEILIKFSDSRFMMKEVSYANHPSRLHIHILYWRTCKCCVAYLLVSRRSCSHHYRRCFHHPLQPYPYVWNRHIVLSIRLSDIMLLGPEGIGARQRRPKLWIRFILKPSSLPYMLLQLPWRDFANTDTKPRLESFLYTEKHQGWIWLSRTNQASVRSVTVLMPRSSMPSQQIHLIRCIIFFHPRSADTTI